MLDLQKVASVIEAAADHFDAIEDEKVSSVRAERQVQIDKLATTYAEATGEELPENIRQKLASSDSDVVELLKSMAEKHAGRVEPMGGPSDRDEEREPTSVKEAAEHAGDRFLNWIVSS